MYRSEIERCGVEQFMFHFVSNEQWLAIVSKGLIAVEIFGRNDGKTLSKLN